jgi:hypothetical protein
MGKRWIFIYDDKKETVASKEYSIRIDGRKSLD